MADTTGVLVGALEAGRRFADALRRVSLSVSDVNVDDLAAMAAAGRQGAAAGTQVGEVVVEITADTSKVHHALRRARNVVGSVDDPDRRRARQLVADVLLDHRNAEGVTASMAAAELDWRIDAGLVPSASVLATLLGRETARA